MRQLELFDENQLSLNLAPQQDNDEDVLDSEEDLEDDDDEDLEDDDEENKDEEDEENA